MKRIMLFFLIIWAINIKRYINYNLKIKLKTFTNKIFMSGRVQLKSTKLQHRKRPRKRKKSSIYPTPVLYHPKQRDYFNLQNEYTCLPCKDILNLLSQNKLYLLIESIRNKNNDAINKILYKDVNNIYIDKNHIYYDEKNLESKDNLNQEIKQQMEKHNNKNINHLYDREKKTTRNFIKFSNFNKYYNNNNTEDDIANMDNSDNNICNNNSDSDNICNNNSDSDNNICNNYVEEKEKLKDNTFIDINNIYFYFKKVNITNINKDNINDDIYKELLQLKKISLQNEDTIGYNIYKYFLNIITNVDREKYMDDFFLVKFINNIWINKNIHKYFYFLNSLYDRMKKISYKLFSLNYNIDIIGHHEEKKKMIYFQRHELFDKIIKKTKYIPNYILKHNYIYSNNIFNLYKYDINTNSYINNFHNTYKEVSVDDFLDNERKKNLNIFYNQEKFQPFYEYAQRYDKNNQMKHVMTVVYGNQRKQKDSNELQNNNDDIKNVVNNNNEKTSIQQGIKNDQADKKKNLNKNTNTNSNNNDNNDINSNNNDINSNNSNSHSNNPNEPPWLSAIRKNQDLKYEILNKICEKMHAEFREMNVLTEDNKIDLNRIDDIKNDKDNLLYKKVYAMRDYFYKIFYDNYNPNLDIYELETYVDAEYRTFSYKKDLDVLFKNWVLNENKQLPVVHFAKKDVELAKIRYMSKTKRKELEFNERFAERHGKGKIPFKRNFDDNKEYDEKKDEEKKDEEKKDDKKNDDQKNDDKKNDDKKNDDEKNDDEKNDDEKNDDKKNDDKKNDDQKNDDEKNDDQKNDDKKNDDEKNDDQKTKGDNNNNSGGSDSSSNTITKSQEDDKTKSKKKVIIKSINCLIKWNITSENEYKKNNDENILKDDDINIGDNDDDDDDDDNDDNIDFNDIDIPNNDLDSYGFCDENIDVYEDEDPTFEDIHYAKLVIYDDNYDKQEFIETLMKYITTCDYKRAYSIYNSLKFKGKVDNLYFKNFERAENIAFLLRQSKQKILVEAEFL
ncbi:conserved Plasmodium protein, unknown function [Plasmodium sp. gorilla clade G2]|uniref:conserved Plasmodium protein, unknown function n=1 Tax=Plasmodium sp. gorilla clade G2 TaxID=880535 RepID=UPI000D2086E4|nr:conserved Plasmodium protein, unknown function [Plasmodium sp. gorilla clade G2]SOV13220.1 conserved Plasmodium protein, unknown function [Plasmodium sp. gorilla clade G2]